MKKSRINNTTFITIIAGIAGILIGVGGAFLTNRKYLAENNTLPQVGVGGGPTVQESLGAEGVISGWPAKSQRVAREIINKYGQPDETTSDRLVWQRNAPWKKTTVFKEGVADNLPGSQAKVLEQVVNYRIPDEKFNELIAYDSAVIADRDKGELTARSDSEAMNFLIVNLANDIMMDEKPLDQAREEYTDLGQRYINGENVPYAEKLQFNVPPAGRVREPGETIMQ